MKFLRASVVTRQLKANFHCARSQEPCKDDHHLCLRTTIQYSRIKRFDFFTQEQNAPASCTTSVYVNLSKNSFFYHAAEVVSSLAGAKVRIISKTTKLLREKFQFLCRIFSALDKNQDRNNHTPYYIIYRRA